MDRLAVLVLVAHRPLEQPRRPHLGLDAADAGGQPRARLLITERHARRGRQRLGGLRTQRFLRSTDGVSWQTLPTSAFNGSHPIFFITWGMAERSSV